MSEHRMGIPADMIATARAIAAAQRPGGEIPWRTGTWTRGTTWSARWRCPPAAWAGRPGSPTSGWRGSNGPTGRGRARTWTAGRPITPLSRIMRPMWRSACGMSSWSRGTSDSRCGCGRRCGRQPSGCSPCRRPAARSRGSATPQASRASSRCCLAVPGILQGLRCAIALAGLRDPQPDWELAAGQLAHVLARHPEAFGGQERVRDGLVLPGPRRCPAGRGGGGAARAGLGRVRRPGPRRPLRQ